MIEIKNRKSNDFNFTEKYVAGLILVGNEIKQIVAKECDLTGSYILINNQPTLVGSYVKVQETKYANNYLANRDRLILLTKSQIRKLRQETLKGLSIIPIRLFSNEKGKIKLEFGVGRSLKKFDKRISEKNKEHRKEIYERE